MEDLNAPDAIFPFTSARRSPCESRLATAVFKRIGAGGVGARLGNQLFLVATTLAVAKDQGRSAVFVLNHSMRPYLRTVYGGLIGTLWRVHADVELGEPWGLPPPVAGQPPLIENLNRSHEACAISLNGYFQDPRHFHHHRQHVADTLWYPPFAEEVAATAAHWLDDTSSLRVAVHVRRGDYANTSHWLGEDYFHAALARVWSADGGKSHRWTCVFFSDDVDFVRDLAPRLCPGKHVIVDEPAEDTALYLMATCCMALVISNSSFSWWAAYLAGARRWAPSARLVVAPRYFGRRAKACTWPDSECMARKDECLVDWRVVNVLDLPNWVLVDDFLPPTCPVQEEAIQAGDPACWTAGFSWDMCCPTGVWGPTGNSECFPAGADFTFDRCCRAAVAE